MKKSLVYVALDHIHHIWHSRERLRESGQTIGRLNKTIKDAVPRTILVSLGRDGRFGDNFAKELQFIPLSNDTVARRNDDIAEGAEQQPLGTCETKTPLCIWTRCMIHREALTSKEMSPADDSCDCSKLHKNDTPKIKNLLWTLQRRGCSTFIVAILL
ncbi:hypothetical protein TNCV_4991331 [Trichonephila clavipes]|nr:hypothetical protein TNCV_4991331 [Trichonephila clavipes]